MSNQSTNPNQRMRDTEDRRGFFFQFHSNAADAFDKSVTQVKALEVTVNRITVTTPPAREPMRFEPPASAQATTTRHRE